MNCILGAGPSGMATAFELHRGGSVAYVIEKNDTVGGLGRTFQYGDFRTDIGPHRFFSKNKYLYDLIEDLLGERWISVDRLTRFYINGKFFNYPVDLKNAITTAGAVTATKIIGGYSYQRVRRVFVKRPPANFEEHAVWGFGRTLAELNMLNYTEKIWGLPCTEISADWASQRIKGLSIIEVLKGAFKKRSGEGPKTLVDRFYYPDTGTALIYESMADKVKASGGKISLRTVPTKISHDGKKIISVTLQNLETGKETKKKVDQLVSSIPINELVELLDPKVPKEVLKAVKSLRYRSHVALFMTVNKSHIFPDQWIYFPDQEVPFGRIMEPKNFSKLLSPDDKSSLLIEFFCWEGDGVWEADKKELVDLSVKWLSKLNFIDKKDVLDSFIHREVYAYPVYDHYYQGHLKKVRTFLDGLSNLQLVGRAGTFRYNNQDHALEMGILAARSIIEGKRYNIDEVGSEEEYFEKGYLAAGQEK